MGTIFKGKLGVSTQSLLDWIVSYLGLWNIEVSYRSVPVPSCYSVTVSVVFVLVKLDRRRIVSP